MRRPEFLSPSQLSTWSNDPEEYYLKYLSDSPPPRMRQTQPMSVGSSFDAYVKCFISEKLGLGLFDFEELFEKQVEEHNRSWARSAGAYAFSCYEESGALDELVRYLESLDVAPRMEFMEKNQVAVGDVVLLGIPDLWWMADSGRTWIHDWKVNGFCGNSPQSPVPGYVNCRDGWGKMIYPMVKHSRGNGSCHRDATVNWEDGIPVNIDNYLESAGGAASSWAVQTTTYAWLTGTAVGDEIMVSIDQLSCSPRLPNEPLIRVAQHRCEIGKGFQFKVYARYQELWEITHSDWIFRQMTREQSAERCRLLDNAAYALQGEDDATIWLRKALGR